MIQPWFRDAKLGIFIHWGIYAVEGIPESWAIFNGEISYADYMAQLSGFTAAHYDPQAWANLFVRSGARYAVLTSKHHDGVALWDTAQGDLSVVHRTPARRDLIAPFCAAMRERDLKVGIYFSHLDWSHPDYAPLPPERRTARELSDATYRDAWPEGPSTPTWQSFLHFRDAQLAEICARLAPDLLWFDGDWMPGAEYWRMADLRARLHAQLPDIVLNSRMCGQGDYATPEQGLPLVPPDGPWEFCMTINDSWGYQGRDRNYKTARQIIRIFAETIGMGGNLLLDVGPMADGSIPPEQVERLEALGSWIRRHSEAIYGTVAGLPAGHVYGASTLAADHRTLYIFLFDRPYDEIAVKGIRTGVRRLTALGTGESLVHRTLGGAPWMNVPGVLWVAVPERALDTHATVLKIELEAPLDLYHGAGQAVERN